MITKLLLSLLFLHTFPHPNQSSHGLVLVMAVDRSKFRTCAQTSFCRRHRHHKPKVTYRLEPSSIRWFESESSEEEEEKEEKETKKDYKMPLWKKFLYGGKGGVEGKDDPASFAKRSISSIVSPTFRGPDPVFYANLIPSGTVVGYEKLDMTIHFHSNSISRIRVTESKKDRVTFDELVLNEKEMEAADHVEFVETVEKRFRIDGDGNKENYRALKMDDKLIVLKLSPFELHLYVVGDDDKDEKTTPSISLNSQQFLYFETQRDSKEEPQPQQVEEQPKKQEKTPEEEKEIVGYWEDGLAIYSDGTREERGNKPEEDEELETLRRLEAMEEAEDTQGLWEEKFHAHHDSKPYGPMSVGLDISFPLAEAMYGIPEHASSMTLKTTTGDGAQYQDPYRLYNLDVFEYELDEPMALYGSIPFLVGHSSQSNTVGVFYFNPTETFVDISSNQSSHWMSESGILDIFLMATTSSPKDLYSQYATLTGRNPLPPMFALGYHQCRWNYKDENDVFTVHSQFEHYDYPYDVLWLDIEHTDGKRYFTWDKNAFPNPKNMIDALAKDGRRMVTIIDPHIKRDDHYHIHKEATKLGHYIKDTDGKTDYDGFCWPGSSSYLDFTDETVRRWFASQFQYSKYVGSTPYLHTWNDMNEPSVFNGPEVSMSKDKLNLKGVEHREWHNLYGMLFHRATHEGLISRNEGDAPDRGFVLSRAFFAGSQRYGAIWTGDNAAQWSHLEIAAQMLLSLNIAGLPFVGADVGGFFGDPDSELFVRWMQAGAYQPFFRGHAHHDAKRREPWVFGDEVMSMLRRVAMERYALLPYWYTVFREAMVTGVPVMRPMWMEYPHISSLMSTDDQWLIGSSLLIKPVTKAGYKQTAIEFPIEDSWYNVRTLQRVMLSSMGTAVDSFVRKISISAPLDRIPVYQRGGTIIPRKLRLRRSTEPMKFDPYTLYVALSDDKDSEGEIYIDDETTLSYEQKEDCALANFVFENNAMTNTVQLGSGFASSVEDALMKYEVERIVVMGLEKAPTRVISVSSSSGEEEDLVSEYSETTYVCVIRKPNLSVVEEWKIQFQF